jgi:Tol biopolymer transport system component
VPSKVRVTEIGSAMGVSVGRTLACSRAARRLGLGIRLALVCGAVMAAGCTSESASSSGRARADSESAEESPSPSSRYQPEGQIAFFRGDQARSVFMVGVAGGRPARLTSPPKYSSGMAWAPDGSRFAYAVGVSKGGFGLLRIVNVATGSERTLVRGRRTSEPSWSPVDEQIAVSGDGDLWVIDVGTGKYGRLTTTRPTCWDAHPSWSPSGQSLVFTRACLERSWLMRLDLDSQDPVRVPGSRGALQPAWSPDGKTVAYKRNVEGRGGIRLISVDGSKKKRLTGIGESFGPAWSPDGRFLAMLSQRSGNDDILVVRVSDGRRWRVTKDVARDSDPAWRPVTD